MANVGIGKLGKSMLFASKKWSAIGGDNEASLVYLDLAKKNPQNTYYIIGQSDWRRMPPEFKAQYPNVVDIWEHYDKQKWPREPSDSKLNPVCCFVYEYLQEAKINLDYALIMSGPLSGANTSGQMKHWDDGLFYTPLQIFQNYAGPIIYYLNKTSLPWLCISCDIRYFPLKARDLFNRPKTNISQYNKSEERWHIKSYEEVLEKVTETEHAEYTGLETLCLIGKKRFDVEEVLKEKSVKMALLSNGSYASEKNSREDIIKRFILDEFPEEDIPIYGDWPEEWTKKYSKFKGKLSYHDIESTFRKVKYTFISPGMAHWVTPKFWEMLNCGCIPFLSPVYDDQHSLPCPEFLRVNTPKELRERIDYLERHPDVYTKLLEKMRSYLLDSYFNGDYISEMIQSKVEKYVYGRHS